MIALLLVGPAAMKLVDIPYPVAGAGDLVVSVELVGVCGSEIHDSRTLQYRRPPVVMGHEISGVLADGTRVAVNPLLSCGVCPACLSGRSNICRSRQILGIHRPGGFTSAISVPATQLAAVPASAGAAQIVMAEPLANAVHAWALSGAGPSARVGILGAGPVGLSVALVASARGVAQVDVVEPVPGRQAAALAVGAAVRGALSDGYDVVFDCVGTASAHRVAVDALVSGGTAVWIGLTDDNPGFGGTGLVRAEKSVRGSYGYTAPEFDEAVQLVTRVPPSWVADRPLSEGPQTFAALWQGRIETPKVAFRPEGGTR